MTLRSAVLDWHGRIAEAHELDALTCSCCQTDSARVGKRTLVVYRDRSDDQVRDIALVALIVGMAFTVPALVLENALPGGGMAEAARLGLALSLLSGPLAVVLSRAGRR